MLSQHMGVWLGRVRPSDVKKMKKSRMVAWVVELQNFKSFKSLKALTPYLHYITHLTSKYPRTPTTDATINPQFIYKHNPPLINLESLILGLALEVEA